MTVIRKHAQKILALCFVLFALCFLWGVSDLFPTGSIRDAGTIRQAALVELLAMEEEAFALDSFMGAWAVVGDRSREIQARILQTFGQATFLTPQLLGAYRLHQAEIKVAGGVALAPFWKNLETLQELPIRVRQVDLGVRNDNQAFGAIRVAWLEQL